MKPSVRKGNRELRGNLAREGDILGRDWPGRASKTYRPDQVASGYHGHDDVRVNPRGEQGIAFRPRRQRVNIDHLMLSPPQSRQITHELDRIANARTDMDTASPGGSEP